MRSQGIPFRMQPQLLRGSRRGFTLEDQKSAGRYWQREQLGRTLAMLDWNRDGRIDLLANHLDAPVSLLQNDSQAQNWLQLELVGVTSERDAIGAEVRVEVATSVGPVGRPVATVACVPMNRSFTLDWANPSQSTALK